MNKIKNYDKLAVTKVRELALQTIEAGLQAIDTKEVIKTQVSRTADILKIKTTTKSITNKNIFICGVGKCALEAAQTLEEILGADIKGGVVMGIQPGSLRYAKYIQGTHPLPSETNVCGATELLEFLKQRTDKDLVLMIISGGGSVLLACHANMQCANEAALTNHLFQNGADIQELNTLRKHLSLARGGNLAAAAYPAEVISIIFSDVPGNTLDTIASGPTVRDTTTRTDAINILKKYNLDRVYGINEECVLETPKENSLFEKTENILLLTNQTALSAMQNKAREHGWNATVQSAALQGDVSTVLDEIIFDIRSALPKTVLIYGGETTMTGTLAGPGGRNQELVMRAIAHIDEGETIIALASDGQDHGEIAGGIADALTSQKAQDKKINLKKLLTTHSSKEFCETTDSAIITGSTGSNVSDLIIAIKE